MKLSTERILTTHVGSLPRPPDVVEFLLARERGEDYDRNAFDRTMTRAVNDIVDHQVALGVDVVSDGEISKLGYSTYVQDRLSGFDGDTERQTPLDLRGYPAFAERSVRTLGKQPFRRAACTGPVEIKDSTLVAKDIQRFKTALSASNAAEGFLNAASPGVIAAFQPNQYYPTHKAYIAALTLAMKPEYEAIAEAGLLLQLDCPDLAMARHTGFQNLTEDEFLKRAKLHVEALNEALENVPAESARIHICWGNYEGPHDHDIELEKILDIILEAKPSAILFEASNPRHAHEWAVWRDAKLPDDKVLVPGVIDSTTNFIEHPELVAQRIACYADIVGRERVIAGTDCGFGTFAGYGKMDPDVSFAKIGAMVEGARMASERLWN